MPDEKPEPQVDEASKWSSRKLLVVGLQLVIMTGLPILYKWWDISETVLLMVLGSTSSLAALYLGANVWAKKFE